MLFFAVVLLASFILRYSYISFLNNDAIYGSLPIGLDGANYLKFANQIISGEYPREITNVSPLYILILHGIGIVANVEISLLRSIQISFGVLNIVIFYLWVNKVFSSKSSGISLLISSFYGTYIMFEGAVLATSVVLLLINVLILLLYRGYFDRRWYWYFLAGIASGLVVAGRPNFIIPALALAVSLLFPGTYGKPLSLNNRLLRSYLFAVGFFVVALLFSVWGARANVSMFGSQGGFNFYIGNNPGATGMYLVLPGVRSDQLGMLLDMQRIASERLGTELSTKEASRFWLQQGLTYICDYPWQAVKLYVSKALLVVNAKEIPLDENIYFAREIYPPLKMAWFNFGVISVLGISGMAFSFTRFDRKYLFLYVLFFSYFLSLCLFFVSARYRVPLTPILIAFSGYLLGEITTRRSAVVASLIVVCSCLVVVPNWFGLDINMWKSISYYNTAISALYDKGSAGDSIKLFNKAISLNDGDAEIYYELGNAQFKQRMYSESVASFSKAAALDRTQPKYIFNIAIAYKNMNEFGNAKKYFLQALAEDPTMIAACINMADIYLYEKNYRESLAYYAMALDIDPNNTYVKYSIKRIVNLMN